MYKIYPEAPLGCKKIYHPFMKHPSWCQHQMGLQLHVDLDVGMYQLGQLIIILFKCSLSLVPQDILQPALHMNTIHLNLCC